MITGQIIKEMNLIGVALIKRNGVLMEGVLPDYVDKETFSRMKVTLLCSQRDSGSFMQQFHTLE